VKLSLQYKAENLYLGGGRNLTYRLLIKMALVKENQWVRYETGSAAVTQDHETIRTGLVRSEETLRINLRSCERHNFKRWLESAV
jgi:hypothetical protein